MGGTRRDGPRGESKSDSTRTPPTASPVPYSIVPETVSVSLMRKVPLVPDAP